MTTWFRDSPLRDVSLPWVDATFLVSKANSYLAVEPDFPSILQTTGRSLTVNGVCLSSRNAFRLTIELPYSLAPTFTLRSFVVGTRTYEFLQSNRANSNSHEGDRQQISEDLCLWKDWEVVNTLHHLRLEQVELDRLSLEHFDFDKIQELKILMLYPWPHTDSNWGHGRMYATSTNDPDACTSLPKEGNEEARLLGEIIRAASKTLRVLFVGSYRIWLQRSENGEITAVPFVSARHNEGQRMVMKREFNQADWDFIDSVPIAPVQVLSPPAREHMARLWTRQSMETVKKRTYATFFKQ